MKLNTHLLYISLIFISVNTFCSLLCIVHIVKSMERTGIRRKREREQRAPRLFTIKFIHMMIAISFYLISRFACCCCFCCWCAVFNWHDARCRKQIDPSFERVLFAWWTYNGYNYWIEHCTTQQQLPQNISIKLGYSQWKFAMAQKLHHFVSKD